MDYGRAVQFGVFVTPDASQPEQLLALAVVGRRAGLRPGRRPGPSLPAPVLRRLDAADGDRDADRRITVFPDVANLPLRPPAVLAKAAASLDLLSGRPGRARARRGRASGTGSRRSAGRCARAANPSTRSRRRSTSCASCGAESRQSVSTASTTGSRACTRGRCRRIRSGSGSARTSPACCRWSDALADGWVPSFGYVQAADLLEGNRRIDEAAAAAGRDPQLDPPRPQRGRSTCQWSNSPR